MIGGYRLEIRMGGNESYYVRVRNIDPVRAEQITRESLNLPANAEITTAPLSKASVMDCPFDKVCSLRNQAVR